MATKLLREQGSGPTLRNSPLLSLMRNKNDMASKIGIQAFTIKSASRQELEAAENAFSENKCGILLVLLERLNNDIFSKANRLP